jgi:predicted MPP superfamily phosphohydrolase
MHVLSFALVALVVLALLHRYAWARLVRDTRMPPRGRRIATVALLLLFLALPAALLLLRRVPVAERTGLTTAVFAWLGLLFYLALFLLAADLLRLGRWIARRLSRRAPPAAAAPPAPPAPGLTRRELFARATAGVVVAGAGSTALAGFSRREELISPEIPVKLARLPRQLDGLRLVQLSDVHLGLSLDRRFLRQCVERANSLRPDAIVITGDLVDAQVDVLGPELAPLQDLRSRFGTFFITGNHEYYSGADEWVDFLRKGGVRVLLNERAVLGDGASLDLAGVTDWSGGHHLPGHEPNLPAALAGRDPERELVLLAHQPRHVDEAAEHDVGLQLSGHTHGGQMWPFGALVGLVQPYVAGLHRHTGRTQIYVSRGTGFWGPPMRVAAPAEIACIVLTT